MVEGDFSGILASAHGQQPLWVLMPREVLPFELVSVWYQASLSGANTIISPTNISGFKRISLDVAEQQKARNP